MVVVGGLYSLGWIRIDCVDQTRFGLKRVFLPVSPECWVTNMNHPIQLVVLPSEAPWFWLERAYLRPSLALCF